MSFVTFFLGRTPAASPPSARHLGEIHWMHASGATNVWVAVDNAGGTINGTSPTIHLYRWNGTAWLTMPAYTDPLNLDVICTGLIVYGVSDVWLHTPWDTAHWNGSTWTSYLYAGGGGAVAGGIMGAAASGPWVLTGDPLVTPGFVGLSTWTGSGFSSSRQNIGGSHDYTPGNEEMTSGPQALVVGGANLYGLAGGPRYLLRVGSGNGVLDTYSYAAENIRSAWKQSDSVAWVAGSRIDVALGVPTARIKTGIGGSWGVITGPPTYTSANPDDLLSLAIYSIGGKDSTDLLICGRYQVNDQSYMVIDRRLSSVWTHYTFQVGSDPANEQLHYVHWIAATDIWCSGTCLDLSDNRLHTYVLHWDGTAWTERPIPP